MKKSGGLNICDRDLVRRSLDSKLNVDFKNHRVLSVESIIGYLESIYRVFHSKCYFLEMYQK